MMDRVLKYFVELSAIPHCSGATDAMREYLVDFAERLDYEVEVDGAGNILIRRGTPSLTLQAHYDMVCVGRAPDIEIYEEGGWLRARDSSLGADNGMAVAMMMVLMEERYELEYLLSNDEEIGLIGAKALDFELRGDYLLNLDTEEEGQIYIGCAGGSDIVASRDFGVIDDGRESWIVSVENLPGGHSGVDIDKNIPNAIQLLCRYLLEERVDIVSLEGGERRNSIAANASAIVKAEKPPIERGGVKVLECDRDYGHICKDSEKILRMLSSLPHGVISIDEELAIPHSSLNLAIVEIKEGRGRIDYSLRAMSDETLLALEEELSAQLLKYEMSVSVEDRYPAWRPEKSRLSRALHDIMRERFTSCSYRAIHAGLECGILSLRYPHMQMASIGPLIENPHSTRERVNIESVGRTFEALLEIVESFV